MVDVYCAGQFWDTDGTNDPKEHFKGVATALKYAVLGNAADTACFHRNDMCHNRPLQSCIQLCGYERGAIYAVELR